VLGIFILFFVFEKIILSLGIALGGALFFALFGYAIYTLYRFLEVRARTRRQQNFYFYDAVRTLVRPLTPTVPITISLVSVTVFFVAFASFSLAFRSQLVLDSTSTANIYAINILETDREKVKNTIGSDALMYDILRARITGINGKTLSEHMGTETASGEFTREFNITTSPTNNSIVR
jgi:predicted lysophospholipase L1 biosynthesis ABC-type transport system permease subunit